MRVITPLTITDAMLTSSTAPEPAASGETAYNAGTTYALGDKAYSTTQHKIYQSLQAGNLNNPFPVLPATATAWWLEAASTNKWAMFDLLRNTQTSIASPLTIVLTPGTRIDSIALLGLLADSVTITATSVIGGGSVYSNTFTLGSRNITNWYQYFFLGFTTQKSIIAFDIPPFTDLILTVVIARTSGNAMCGSLVIGLATYIGEVEVSATSSALNFSTVTRDIYGNSVLIPRRNVPKTNQKVFLDKSLVNTVIDLRTSLNASPAVWSGLDDITNNYFEALLILGLYKKFDVTLEAYNVATIDLELEEI